MLNVYDGKRFVSLELWILMAALQGHAILAIMGGGAHVRACVCVGGVLGMCLCVCV